MFGSRINNKRKADVSMDMGMVRGTQQSGSKVEELMRDTK